MEAEEEREEKKGRAKAGRAATGQALVSAQTGSVACRPDAHRQRLLTCWEPRESNEKDDLKATNTRRRDGRYRTMSALVKLPIGVSVLGRVSSPRVWRDGEPRLWLGKSHNNGA